MANRWKHFKTVMRHKRYVFRECRHCGIGWQGFIHDLSKFSLVEFNSSAQYFQGTRSPIKAEKIEKGYSYAWQHHMGHNPHHWQYWLDYASDGHIITVKMPYKYVVEMVCDWIGAGKAYNRKGTWSTKAPLDHYRKQYRERHLHPDTDDLLKFFCLTIRYFGLEKFYKYARSKDLKQRYENGEGTP